MLQETHVYGVHHNSEHTYSLLVISRIPSVDYFPVTVRPIMFYSWFQILTLNLLEWLNLTLPDLWMQLSFFLWAQQSDVWSLEMVNEGMLD